MPEQFDNGPVFRKKIVIARPIGNFKNGDQVGVLDPAVIKDLVENFRTFNKAVPIFAFEHVDNLDSKLPDGWVEGVAVRDDGMLEADVKIHGAAVPLVLGDLLRYASIAWRPAGRDYQGKKIGAVMTHVALTNNPYIKDLPSILAACEQGAGELEICMAALPTMEADMADENKDEKIAALEAEVVKLKAATLGEKAEAMLEAKEKEIVEQKAQVIRLTNEVSTLNEQLANAKADPDKESALEENINLKRKDFLRDVREIIAHGLDRGTLLAKEVTGYAGKGPLDFMATERWLKTSEFYDKESTLPEADKERMAFQVIKHVAMKTAPRVTIGARYQSGAPKENNVMTLSDSEKRRIREQGFDPERVAHMTDSTSYEDWKELPKSASAGGK